MDVPPTDLLAIADRAEIKLPILPPNQTNLSQMLLLPVVQEEVAAEGVVPVMLCSL